jgi:hypothetical protein
MRALFKASILFCFIGLGLLLIYIFAMLNWSYAEGERAGYIQKFSKKGWVCKTWEGELALVSVPGTIAEKFYFTVRDEDTAGKINANLGRKVALKYEQHVGLPSDCFGETSYFITAVIPLD